MHTTTKVRAAACLGATALLGGLLGLPGAGAATAPSLARPAPVSPAEAVRITEALAKQAPPLPAAVKAQLDARYGRKGPAAPAHVLTQAAALIAADAARSDAALEPGHGDHETVYNGVSCLAQGFAPNGKPYIDEEDVNKNKKIDPWEEEADKNETCVVLATLPYDQARPDKGSFMLEKRTEKDYDGLRTFTRHALRWNYVVTSSHGHADKCVASEEEGAAAYQFLADTKAALVKYKNNPQLLRLEGYWPYPVGNSKTYHWFNSGFANPQDTTAGYWEDGKELDPTRIEMITFALTDEGYLPFNTAYVHNYHGDKAGGPAPLDYDANLPANRLGNNNRGAGCLVRWHGHNGQADGTATGNLEGRTWMAHLDFYGGVSPFNESFDASEPHGWFTPFNNIPVGGNSEGTGV